MRIGIDCLALQSDSRNRGIGRFSKNFLDTLLTHTENEYILYIYDGLPIKMVPTKNVQWINVWPGGPSHQTGLENSVHGNPDKLDALLLLSPHESYVRKTVGIPRIYAVVYDLIPLLFKERYLEDPWFRDLYYKYLNAICDYDHLFTLSESARNDILREMPAVSRESVSVIGAATDPIFSPAYLPPVEVDKPYFLHIGGGDIRKGGAEVLKAFSLLPNRDNLNLVFCYGADKEHINKMKNLAQSLGVENNFLFYKYMSDTMVRRLYSQSISMILPSQYEGFGLPILEAMSCGTSVVAGNNSSQVELVHSVGVLTDPNNIEALCNIMYILSTDKDLNDFIKRQCLERSKEFSWESVIDKFIKVITKPRLAVFSPVPPTLSGISDYIVNLLPYLSETFDITIYIDGNYMPENLPWKILPHSSFNPKKHDHILYQMGNSEYHRYMYPYIMRYSGVVTLHDFGLAGFHNNYDEVVLGHFQKQVELAGEKYDESISLARDGRVSECMRRGLYLNGPLINASKAVITHTQKFATHKKVHHVPFPKAVTSQSIKDCQPQPIKIVVPGWLSDTKLNFLCLQSFIIMDNPNTRLIFAGDGNDRNLRELVDEWGISEKVVFTGRLTKEQYEDIIREADIGVILRKPPTNGETSAALFDLLAAGVPTIVSQVGSFQEIPDNVVLKFIGDCEIDLCSMMDSLVNSQLMRWGIGKAGRDFVQKYHDPKKSAEMYSEIILGGH
jgi:glycosyltransferase involved in cell wall biosynthesis